MRFGFKLPQQGTAWSAMRDVWRAGDALPVFESGWTYDHLVALKPAAGGFELDTDTPLLEGWTLLAALAAETSRLRLGNLVTCVPFHHPAVLAKVAATVDAIAPGRLDLGLGAGWMEPEAEMFGIDLGTPRDRLDRLEETLAIILPLLRGESVDHDGRFYRLRRAAVSPVPVRPPPLWLGGNGERRTLRLVARYADAWNYTALRPDGAIDAFARKREVLAEHCDEIGRDPSEVLVTVQLSFADDPSRFADEVVAWRARGAEYVVVMLPAGTTPGGLAALADALEPLTIDTSD
jgi:F420-dependent oxidoreductase-like protein